MDETKLIEEARERSEVAVGVARSPFGPAVLLSSRDAVEREHRRTLHLCDALEASHERDRQLKAEIQRYIDSEKAAAGPDMGTVRQSVADGYKVARIAALSSVLYMIEKGAE